MFQKSLAMKLEKGRGRCKWPLRGLEIRPRRFGSPFLRGAHPPTHVLTLYSFSRNSVSVLLGVAPSTILCPELISGASLDSEQQLSHGLSHSGEDATELELVQGRVTPSVFLNWGGNGVCFLTSTDPLFVECKQGSSAPWERTAIVTPLPAKGQTLWLLPPADPAGPLRSRMEMGKPAEPARLWNSQVPQENTCLFLLCHKAPTFSFFFPILNLLLFSWDISRIFNHPQWIGIRAWDWLNLSTCLPSSSCTTGKILENSCFNHNFLWISILHPKS